MNKCYSRLVLHQLRLKLDFRGNALSVLLYRRKFGRVHFCIAMMFFLITLKKIVHIKYGVTGWPARSPISYIN